MLNSTEFFTSMKVILTLVVILIGIILKIVVYSLISRRAKKDNVSSSRKKGIRKVLSSLIWVFVIVSIIMIWGIEFQNIWVTLLSFLALVAIGFFAVWSMLSNILAGIIIFFAKPFKSGDNIKIIPEGIEGRVVSVGSVFTTLKTKKEIVNIPNNLVMQRIILRTI